MFNIGFFSYYQQINKLTYESLDWIWIRDKMRQVRKWQLTAFEWYYTCMSTVLTKTYTSVYAVFPPDRTIAEIPRCIQRGPPEKWRKGQFSLLLLLGCMRAKPGHSILIAIPRLKIATDTITNELTIYNTTKISFLANGDQKFWFSHHNRDFISICGGSIIVLYAHLMFF